MNSAGGLLASAMIHKVFVAAEKRNSPNSFHRFLGVLGVPRESGADVEVTNLHLPPPLLNLNKECGYFPPEANFAAEFRFTAELPGVAKRRRPLTSCAFPWWRPSLYAQLYR